MFCLNITQIQCLITMKMLTKTYVNKEHDRAIKSFFCKVALFYSIEKTHNEDWEPANIIPCIVKCVQWLVDCLKLNSMPHYFMPSLNMLEGRFQSSEGLCLVKVLSDVVSNIEESIRGIRIDQVGSRLLNKMGDGHNSVTVLYDRCTVRECVQSPKQIETKIGMFLLDA